MNNQFQDQLHQKKLDKYTKYSPYSPHVFLIVGRVYFAQLFSPKNCYPNNDNNNNSMIRIINNNNNNLIKIIFG